MLVVCFEGCHGSGKTALVQRFKELGFQVLDEAFLNMPRSPLPPQSLVMESIWVSQWIQRILALALEDGASEKLYIADRSPYSAEFYADHGHLLRPILDQQIQQLHSHGIHVVTVYIKVQTDLLWHRILDRLQREPHRLKYHEDSREWMERCLRFYDSHHWDFIVANDERSIADTQLDVVSQLKRTEDCSAFFGNPIKAVM
ncbi:hypothetical protein PAPYR_4062 [Paratrimastix pyriformis]|uniref:NadR/Ttd14 AAA domain-containing protein n=1 Tax=Paratrimastix pyriformis TaxID=342808 RepID=A0ABQ8ULB1_9EUKA|nr:hypothetical protein PAPYR_4062 [Paratrimastix pyriformis]|eukprot:GAFH01002137.1.p1 GENE.GAFH01002137.1~~GAFH01002137.1.p1  ORF type:complete len:213 (+),score=8.68 GAFH01002137.1:39-641(+)